ncbi:ABC transporter permease [Candidatus Woesearchaeota archaeon]|nr:ABC transporter permease [Candidatus Woesearchaeota archaeon]
MKKDIFIGIASVVALIGLGEGLRTAITSQFGFLGSDVLTVQAAGIAFAGPPGQAVSKPLDDDLAKKIGRIRGVDVAFNRQIESAAMEFNDQQQIIIVGSVPVGENRKIFERMVNLQAADGRLLAENDDRRVLLGSDFGSDEQFGKRVVVGTRVLIKNEVFEVAGILKEKGSFIFDQSAFLNEDVIDDILDVKEGEEDFTVESPQSILESLDSTLFAVQLFVSIIAAISLFVGGIGIMNTMYTSVVERTRQIGIMKSVGAKNSTIFTLFFLESGLLGAAGGIIGIVLGLIMAYGLAAFGRLVLGTELIQAQVSWTLILGALLFSFVLGTLSGLLPAVQASRMQPVEALRT